MNRQRLKFHNRLRCWGLVVLFLWLKGVGCAICCTTAVMTPLCHNGQAAVTPASEIDGRTDESAWRERAGHEMDCCRRPVRQSFDAQSSPAENKPAPLRVTGSRELKACSLLASQTLAFTVSPKSIAPSAGEAESSPVVAAITNQTDRLFFARPCEPRNRGGTHLRCCVLLI